MRRSMRFRAMQARLGTYPYSIYKVVQSAGGYGMESPGLTWIPYGVGSANLRYLVAHETAHQWFYGLVGNDQARQPFADEAVADFVARDVTGTRRVEPVLDRSARPLDLLATSRACYYEIVYIQGGNLLNDGAPQDGVDAVLDDAPRVRRGAPVPDRRRRRPCSTTLDDATPVDLSPMFRPRFPRSTDRGHRSRRGPATAPRPAPAASAGRRPAAPGSTLAIRRRATPRPRAARWPPAEAVGVPDGRRQQPDRRPQRPVVEPGRHARAPSAPGSGGWRIASARSRAVSPTWTGPSGRQLPSR